jgi:hypothetical protein
VIGQRSRSEFNRKRGEDFLSAFYVSSVS